MADRFDAQRFVNAQASTYAGAVSELRRGRKLSHWMWFVFPQVAGLGRSQTAQHYALGGIEDAAAYLVHPVLGERIRECARLLLELPTTNPVQVFGAVDAQKLQSSMTLFALSDPQEPLFRRVLDRYFAGELDEGTTSRV